ncbi:MAG: tetratricopeptide repeat protein, partial [Acidobacteriota bacterium]|nr:tetratricopeptide repeat protein [Acidobacteriota bacterium]
MRMTPRNVLFLSVLLSLVALAACGGGKTQPTTAPRELTVEEKARKAQSMLRAGRARDAIVIMEDALAETPDDARLHNLMGQIMFVAARYEPAVEHFNRALELDEYLTDAHNFLGAVYNELGKTNEAEKHFRIALDDPSYPTPQLVWLNLGMLYGGQGR